MQNIIDTEEKVENLSGPVNNLMESKTSVLDDVLNSKLENALSLLNYEGQVRDIGKIASEHDPIDIAYAASKIPSQSRIVLFQNLQDFESQIIFLINTDSSTRTKIFRHLDDKKIVELINQMPTDEAVWVLDDISDRRFRVILPLISETKREAIVALRLTDRHSAARLMVNEFCAFRKDASIEEVREHIRNHPNIEVTRRIFVLDDNDKVKGYVPARNLIINDSKITLTQIMRPLTHQVSPEATREEVIDVVERYKIPALPVIDEAGHLVGVITYEDVVEALEDITDETLAKVGGTSEHVGGYEPVMRRLLLRAPWLFVTLIAGLVNALVMAFFDNKEGSILAFVLFFVPMITGMSGNIGIQCSTVIVRGMATGMLSSGSKKEAIKKEIIIGTSSGLFFGILAGLIVYFIDIVSCPLVCINPIEIGITVSVGLMGACLCGTFLGVFSPFFFVKVGVDPAIASGPIITAFNDFLSMVIYFILAWVISTLFFL